MHRFKPKNQHGSHCTSEQIEALEDGELSQSEERRLLRHLESCAACRSERLQSSRTLSLSRQVLAQHPRLAVPHDFDAQVWAKIEERQQHATPLSRLGAFVLHPVPRLFSSALFGLLAALAFGQLASGNLIPNRDTNPFSAAMAPVSVVSPPSPQ